MMMGFDNKQTAAALTVITDAAIALQGNRHCVGNQRGSFAFSN
jgi:hypothetical protein